MMGWGGVGIGIGRAKGLAALVREQSLAGKLEQRRR